MVWSGRFYLSSLLIGCESLGVRLSFPIAEAMSQGALRGCALRFLEVRLSWRRWRVPLAVVLGLGERGVPPFPHCSGSSGVRTRLEFPVWH